MDFGWIVAAIVSVLGTIGLIRSIIASRTIKKLVESQSVTIERLRQDNNELRQRIEVLETMLHKTTDDLFRYREDAKTAWSKYFEVRDQNDHLQALLTDQK